MLVQSFWILGAFLLTLVVGPISILSSQIGHPDPADLYLLLDFGRENPILDADINQIGPIRGLWAQMIHASTEAHHYLVQSGHLMLPASTLAQICGLAALPIDTFQK